MPTAGMLVLCEQFLHRIWGQCRAPPEALPAPYGRRIVRRLVGRLVTRWNQVLDFAERLLHLQRDIRRAHYELKTLQLSPTELSSLAQWHSGSDSIRAVCGI